MVQPSQVPQYGVGQQGGAATPPPTQYGAPAIPGAGVPAVPGAIPGMVQPDVKWSGLSTGGAFKVPVTSFIGRLVDMIYDPQSQFGLRIIEKYDQVQILASPVPWPWATIDISIKYSEKEDSGWGRHVGSAKTIGLAQAAASLDEAKADLVGKMYELSQADESYGEDAKTGQSFHGDVWRFMRIVTPGAPISAIAPQPVAVAAQPAQNVAAPAPVAVPAAVPPVAVPVAAVPVAAPVPVPVPIAETPATPAPAPVPAPAPAVAPVAPAAEAPAPAAVSGAAIDVTILETDTAAIRAKKLLNGKALNEWLGVALLDAVIKADAAFVNSIFDQSFIVGLKAANLVTLGTDGKFTVIA